MSLCNLLECFISEKFGFPIKEKQDLLKRCLIYVFAYAFIWSLGTTVHEKHFDELNTLIRDAFPSVIFPNIDSIYGFYLDIT